MSTVTPPAPAQLRRLGENLLENARVIARDDPEYAYVMKFAGEAMKNGKFLDAFLNGARPPRLVTGAQQVAAAARADEWLEGFLRDAARDDGLPPSNRTIFQAAALMDPPRLPRRVIESAIKRRRAKQQARQKT